VVWIDLLLSFFQRRRVVAGVFLPDMDAPVQGERHDQEQAIQAIRGAQLVAARSNPHAFGSPRSAVRMPSDWCNRRTAAGKGNGVTI